jgi:hypothetical protein
MECAYYLEFVLRHSVSAYYLGSSRTVMIGIFNP